MKNYIPANCASQLPRISALLLALANPCFGQQTQPALQISSPTDGVLVNPGQTISVTVTSPAGLAFAYIAVNGPGGLVGSNASVPTTLSITIPTKISPRKYNLTAIGKTAAGQTVFSKAISLSVERADTPTRLVSDPPTLPFRAQGQSEYLTISGTFADGTTLDVTESAYMSYSSSNTAVATVNATGLVRAVGPGKAIIEAAYSGGPRKGVPVSVANGPLKPSPASLSFGAGGEQIHAQNLRSCF
jgi:hypothetical protein